jgi:hypothetical protein
MAVFIAPAPRQQFFDSNGDPISGGQLFTYEAGTTTKAATYTTSTGLVANTNPIVLDSSGRTPSGIWLTDGQSYKFVLAPSGDTDPPASPIFTEDNVDGTNDFDAASAQQWVVSGLTPTFVSSISFTVTGDQTSTLDVGRRLQLTVSAGTVYGHILTSTFTSLTTVTMTMDSGDSLDSGLSAFNYSVLSGTNHAVPKLTDAKWIAVGVVVKDSDNTLTGTLNMSGKAINTAVHTEAAHATTSDIWAGGNVCLLSGAVVTFTDVADAPQAGAVRYVVANDAHIITDNAALEVDGNANYTCGVGDVLRFEAKTTSTFRVSVVSTGDRTPKTEASTTVKGIVELATESEVEANTPSTTLVPSIDSLRSGFLVHGTYTATTSGTSATFSSIPSWVKKFSIYFVGVSTNGTSGVMLRIGDSGGVETTGYACTTFTALTGVGTAIENHNNGFIISTGNITTTAADVRYGKFVFSLVDEATNTWDCTAHVGHSNRAIIFSISGSKALSDTLDRVELNTEGGSDTFDAGNWQIVYEG